LSHFSFIIFFSFEVSYNLLQSGATLQAIQVLVLLVLSSQAMTQIILLFIFLLLEFGK